MYRTSVKNIQIFHKVKTNIRLLKIIKIRTITQKSLYLYHLQIQNQHISCVRTIWQGIIEQWKFNVMEISQLTMVGL
jgi:hypothetical protein